MEHWSRSTSLAPDQWFKGYSSPVPALTQPSKPDLFGQLSTYAFDRCDNSLAQKLCSSKTNATSIFNKSTMQIFYSPRIASIPDIRMLSYGVEHWGTPEGEPLMYLHGLGTIGL
jgi:hypothetical protein